MLIWKVHRISTTLCDYKYQGSYPFRFSIHPNASDSDADRSRALQLPPPLPSRVTKLCPSSLPQPLSECEWRRSWQEGWGVVCLVRKWRRRDPTGGKRSGSPQLPPPKTRSIGRPTRWRHWIKPAPGRNPSWIMKVSKHYLMWACCGRRPLLGGTLPSGLCSWWKRTQTRS